MTSALAVTWSDGTALSSYGVTEPPPDAPALEARLRDLLKAKFEGRPLPNVTLTFDDHGSPWHTRCVVEASDVRGLLHGLTVAFASVGVNVHAASITTDGSRAVDTFELTDKNGAKLDDAAQGAAVHGRRAGCAAAWPAGRALASWACASSSDPTNAPRSPTRCNRISKRVVPTSCWSGHRRGEDQQWAEVGRRVGETVARGDADTGVLFCWTGTGASIAANKVAGVRAALCTDAATAEGARKWNDANVLVMSLRLTSAQVAHEMLDAWFTTEPDPSEAANIAALE